MTSPMMEVYRTWALYLAALEAHDGPAAAQAMSDYLAAVRVASETPVKLAGFVVA